MTLYKNKYRIESARCPQWDYTSNGHYFVTICTHNRQHFFGNVIVGKMQLSDIGVIVAQEWQKTPHIRPNVQLDEWVVMPNHFHGIIIINNPEETFRRNVSNTKNETTQPETNNKSRLKPNSLGSIIGQFKSVCTKQIRKIGFTDFCWQTRFHDHIIRDEKSLQRVRQYIINNPAKWELDRNNRTNIRDVPMKSL
ncbi:MAG: transposase [Xenococcaceae cyanobacterium MO_188.B19]|nr:transposase [Xenococcaceae cyanobacterium MO_188.B19]